LFAKITDRRKRAEGGGKTRRWRRWSQGIGTGDGGGERREFGSNIDLCCQLDLAVGRDVVCTSERDIVVLFVFALIAVSFAGHDGSVYTSASSAFVDIERCV